MNKAAHSRVPEIEIQARLAIHAYEEHANDMSPRREQLVQLQEEGRRAGGLYAWPRRPPGARGHAVFIALAAATGNGEARVCAETTKQSTAELKRKHREEMPC